MWGQLGQGQPVKQVLEGAECASKQIVLCAAVGHCRLPTKAPSLRQSTLGENVFMYNIYRSLYFILFIYP